MPCNFNDGIGIYTAQKTASEKPVSFAASYKDKKLCVQGAVFTDSNFYFSASYKAQPLDFFKLYTLLCVSKFSLAMKNQDTWQFAHHYFGKLWFKMGLWLLVLTVAAMLPGLGKDADAVGKLGGLLCLAQLPVMLYAIFPTERALKKTFDKDGNRKKT